MDVAELGVKVTLDGVAQATAGLNSVGAAGDKAAASVADFARAGASASQIAQLTGASVSVARDAVARYGTQAAETAGEVQGLALAQQEAAAAGIELGASADVAALSLGRLRQSMATMGAEALGIPTIFGRVGSTAASAFGVGSLAAIGMFAAIAAGHEVYAAWAEDSEKASSEQDKLTDSLTKWHDKQKEGAAGDLPAQIQAMTDKIIALHKEMDGVADGKFFATTKTIGAGGSVVDAVIRIFTAGSIDQMAQQAGLEVAKGSANIAKQVTDGGAAIAAAQAEAAKKISDAADKAQKERLTAMEAEWEAAIPPANAFTDSLVKQTTQLEKANESGNKMVTLAQQDLALSQVQGEAHDYLAAAYKAQNDAADAASKYTGQALEDMLADIARTKALTDERIRLTQANKDAADATAQFNAISGEAGKIAAANIKATTDAAKQALADQAYADSIDEVWAKGIEKIVTNGTKSFHNFFDDVLSLFDSLMQKMVSKYGDAAKEMGKYQALSLGASAITGGVAGYQIGQSTGSTVTGVFGGAASGALAGNEILPGGWGAVIGGLSGAAGGLIGAAKSQEDAAKALQQAVMVFNQNLATYAASTSDPVTQKLVAINAQAAALWQTADTLMQKGAISMSEFAKDTTTIQNTVTAQYNQIVTDFWDGITQAINATKGSVGAYQNQLDALKKSYDDNMASAEALHASDVQLAEITDLYRTQVDQLKASYQETVAQIKYSLDAREAYAKGLTAEGDAITRKAAEEKELFDDAQAGYTAEQLARVAYIQGLEDQAKAEADAKAAIEKYTQSMATLTTTFLTLTGQTDAAAQATLAEQQRQAVNQAIADNAPADQMALLSVVQLFQRGQLAAQQAIQHQTDAINANLKVDQDALSVAQSQLQALQQAANSLKTFDQSLTTGSLSPLSPVDQLAAAKAARDALFQAASGGDATAAGQYGAAAQNFLQLSQGYNASGAGYQSDYASTKAQADQLATQYAHQASLQQQTVDALNASIKVLQDQLATLQSANTLTQMTRDAVIAELERTRDATLAPNGQLIDQFNALKDTLTGVGSVIAQGERDLLVSDQNTVTQATANEIAAINAGASAAQIASLDQLRVLEEQKTSIDDGYAAQIQAAAQQYGWDSPQVLSIISLQAHYDAGVTAQIHAINGVAQSVNDWLSTQPVGPTTGAGLPIQPSNPLPIFPGGPHFANGGDFGGGMMLVGERGPELVTTGAARITNTEALLSALSNGGNNAALIAEVKALRSDVQSLYALNQAVGKGTVAGLGAVADRVDVNTDKTVRGLERVTSKIAS